MSDGGEKRAVILVRNPCTHDARILREARTLRSLGYRPLVVAVTSEEVRMRRASADGVPILRLSPTSPFAWARSLLRRADPIPRSSGPTGASVGDVASPGSPSSASPRSLASLAIRLHRWLRTLDFYRRSLAVVRTLRPALVHCNDYNTMWVGVAARSIFGTAVVYDAHELWPDRNLRPEPRWWLLACEALFVRVAHRVITASPGYAAVMARRYRMPPPIVVRNIPDLPRPEAAPDRSLPSPGAARPQPTVAYVGALTRNRGLEVSVRALTLVPEVRLRLIGPVHAPYQAELAALAREEGVEDRLEFAPPVPPQEVVKELRPADVGLALIQPVCLSYRMSLPNKLFEYLAAGLPVLGSDLPVIGGFVREHGVGAVARADDVADVAAKIRDLLGPDRNASLRAAVRETAEGLRWSTECAVLAGVYEDAVAEAAAREPAGPG